MPGRGLADPCPHFLWGPHGSRGDRRSEGPGARGQGWWAHVWHQEDRVLPAAKAGGQEDRAIIPTHMPLGHQHLLASLHLLPQALCTARFGAQRSLDPLQRRVD